MNLEQWLQEFVDGQFKHFADVVDKMSNGSDVSEGDLEFARKVAGQIKRACTPHPTMMYGEGVVEKLEGMCPGSEWPTASSGPTVVHEVDTSDGGA